MSILEYRQIASVRTPDDEPLFVIRNDVSGGVNTHLNARNIAENQCEVLQNVEIEIAGQRSKMRGSTLIGNDVGSESVLGLHNYIISGGSTPQLLMYTDVYLYKWSGSGNWSELKNNFNNNATEVGFCTVKKSGTSPDDVCIIQNALDNAFQLTSAGTMTDLGSTAGTGSDSPPKSTVMAWYGNRMWVLKDDLLYFSDAYPSDYSKAFDTASNAFRIPVGDERYLLPTRDFGIVVFGKNAIWGLSPSAVPDAATDAPVPIITDNGCVSKNAVVQGLDDIYWFAQDGVRALRRNIQDKLQQGRSYPLSIGLKSEYDLIDWSKVTQIRGVYWNNRVIFSVPLTGGIWSTWIYYPATNGWVVKRGWYPCSWATYKVTGEERLFYGKINDAVVYRAFYGFTDEGTTATDGTAITYTEEGRKEDMGQPLINKVGGELEIKANTSGNYNLSVYGSFDDDDYTLLGTMNILGGNAGVTFPVTFPVSFSDYATVRQKFHLDAYGAWRTFQHRIVHATTNSTNDITILEHSIVTYPEKIEGE